MNIALPPTIFSNQDLRSLTNEIKSYNRWLSHQTIKQKVGVTSLKTPPDASPAAVNLLKQLRTIKPLDVPAIDELIIYLEKLEAKAPQVTITLAAPATNVIKTALVGWFRTNYSPESLINFSFDSTQLGGMTVRAGSRIFDWTFRRQILDKRYNFPGVLRRVR